MQLYVGDYLRDTRHLTAEQHGAYMLLLMSMWAAGGPLPNDAGKLARLASCTRVRWAKIADEVMEFFEVQGDVITQPRLMKELEKAQEKSIKRAEAGSRGGRAKALKTNEPTVANATGLLCHSSEPEPEKIIEAKASLSPAPPLAAPVTYPEPFEAAWKAYPHVKGRSSKPKALGQWRRLSPATRQALPSAIARYAREGREPKADCGAPAMQRWLLEARFSDWMADAETSSAGAWDDGRWSAVLALNREEGWWQDSLGPRPGEPGCRVPAHIINPVPQEADRYGRAA